ncbi:hypothetical protein P7L53_12355 [Thermoleptolyngbya sichuanensis XZ-Cy5]|uniref:hypothetical protein n=1 Tax=Thermoleptolyngbya sichuanensis TaxID=2885951 RepID=UPI00240DD35D|nr:hypothetical protein [Thermoleptolyngbya sichuanensis]MDG2617031.1 hypothetical protein [Thermoleptolyngbya sichuanensis XZ-Cy5]
MPRLRAVAKVSSELLRTARLTSGSADLRRTDESDALASPVEDEEMRDCGLL